VLSLMDCAAFRAARRHQEVPFDMPTYEYECKACGHAFEKFQSITARPIKTCPKCGGEVIRLISAGSGLIFKGSGFYETDYRSAEYKRRAREEGGGGSGKSGSGGKSKGDADS
jgi:putative FmdB family regulatory protein